MAVDLKLVDDSFVPVKGEKDIAKLTQGKLAAAIREGRQREREVLSEVVHLRAELNQRPTQHAYGRHGMARLAQGAVAGMIAGTALGASLVALAFQWSMRESFTNAADYGSRMVVSGAALQSANPAERCIPGEQLADGRRCPQ